MVSQKENEAIKKLREEKCNVDGCQMEDTGVCALHDVEVERRASMKVLVDKIPSIMTKLNIIIGTTGLVGMIIAASFVYTTMVKSDLRDDISSYKTENRASVTELRSLVHEIAVTQGRNIQAQETQIQQLSKLNGSLSNIIDRQMQYENSINKRIDSRFDSWGNRNNQQRD